MWELTLKVFRNIGYCLSKLSLKLQVGSMGAGSKVLPGVLVSSGKNISIGKGCFIGRGVVLDAKSGSLEIGDGVELRDHVRIYSRDISIGSHVTLGEGTFLNGKIQIAEGAWLARGCDLTGQVILEKSILGPHVSCIGGVDHARDQETSEVLMAGETSPSEGSTDIHISKGAWVGQGAILLKGVHLPPQIVVGAGSVVTRGDYLSGSVIAGNPAKPISSQVPSS